MFLQEMNEETDRKEKGHSNAGKESGGVEACSGHSGLPKTLDHPARGYQSTDPVAGLPMHSPHWPSLASLRLCSWATTHTHTYTHPALTAAPIRQHKVLLLPPPNPGCPSRQESKARLNLERVNKVEERKKERHRPSPTSLLPVLLFAR